MIPKVIHYCWFGGNEKNELIKKCIESWKIHAPEFEIIEWNESNFDVNKYKYASQAYTKQKYAFVSDVVRFDVLYRYGGIYLDTDVELLKNIDELVNSNMFMAYDQRKKVASGLIFGSVKEHFLLKEILDYYETAEFVRKNNIVNTTTVVTIVSNVLTKNNYVLDGNYFNDDGIVIYPYDYFDPYDYENNQMKLSDNTIAIHHYAASWKNDSEKRVAKVGMFIKKLVGKRLYEKMAKIKHAIFG